MKNILIIGGSGTWSGQAYIPSIELSPNLVTLVGILDPINPYYSSKTISYFDYFTKHHVQWIKSKRDCDEELVEKCITEYDIDIVIISTPPKFHYDYTLACLKCGVDIICDKPIIATPKQSSFSDMAVMNIKKHKNLLQAIRESHHRKQSRQCFVLTPLRRKLQNTYTNLYDSIRDVRKTFHQDITNILISHNDGVFRFEDEVELKCGSHGYADGFGKLTHTGYHILDLVAGLIEFGCNTLDVQCICKIINCNTVEDMLKSDSNKISAKLLHSHSRKETLSDVTLSAEMDITISYTLYHKDQKFCNIVVDLLHCGKSNRTLPHYDFYNYNDQGRTNELTMHVQQGNLFSTQLILSTQSTSSGTIGNGYTLKNYHPMVAKKLNQQAIQVLDFQDQSFKTTTEFISDFYQMICNGTLDGYYLYVDFLNQMISDELYIAALIAKTSKQEFKWNLGNISEKEILYGKN